MTKQVAETGSQTKCHDFLVTRLKESRPDTESFKKTLAQMKHQSSSTATKDCDELSPAGPNTHSVDQFIE